MRGLGLRWFRSYLNGRKQFATVGESRSQMSDVIHGVPQGSILGPLLFILYLNEMSACATSLSFKHCADGTRDFC